MLDTLLSRLKEEIAIDGPTGSSIDTVWKYAESVSKEIAKHSDLTINPKIDAPYKAFIWNYLKQDPELTFYQDTTESASLDMQIDHATLEQDIINAQADEDTNQAQKVPLENSSSENEQNINGAPESQLDFMEYIHGTTEKERGPLQTKGRKRKTGSTKKVATSKKKSKPAKKTKPTKKPKKKKKKDMSGHSDSDFEMDSDESGSEYSSDITEHSSEGYSEQEEDGEDDLAEQKYAKQGKPSSKMSNPVHVQQQPEIASDNSGLKDIENIADLNYEQAFEQYGPRLRILASARLQEEQLFFGIPPGANLSPSLIPVLKAIIKTRTQGLYQASITKLLNFDPRSTGHYVKTLEEKGAITRRGVSINHMRTNICIHTRFCLDNRTVDMNTVGEKEDDNEVPYNVNASGRAFSQKDLLFAMVDFANAAPNGMVLAQDILHGLGFNSTRHSVRKWFNRSIDEICQKGYFEKGSIRMNDPRIHRCLRLLKLPEDYIQQEAGEVLHALMEEITFPIKIKNTKNCDIPTRHLLCDAPLDFQTYEVVAAGGINGATQKDVAVALSINEVRILGKVMEKLVDVEKGRGFEQYGVVRYLEFERRVRRYRYFTLAASIKVNEARDYEPPPSPDVEFDESKFYERNIYLELPHKWSDFLKYRRLVKKAGGNRDISFKVPWVPRVLRNADGTPRKKSKYILRKEQEMRAAMSQQESGSSADGPQEPEPTVPIHPFFTKPRKPRKPLPPPAPGPSPAPIISAGSAACPAVVVDGTPRKKRQRNAAPKGPAPKKRKYTKRKAQVNNSTEPDSDVPVEESQDLPEIDATAKEPIEQPKDDTASQETAEQLEDDTAPQETVEQPKDDAASEETVEQPRDDAAAQETVEQPKDDTASQETVEQPKDDATVQETVEQPKDDAAYQETIEQLKDDTGISDEMVAEPQDLSISDQEASKPSLTETENELNSANETEATLMDYAPEEQPQPQLSAVEETSNVSSVTQASVDTPQTRRRSRRTIVNAYMEARIKLLYGFLEETRIIEMSKVFNIEFSKRAAIEYKGTRNTIDGKTLWNTALELERRGQAQTVIVDCPIFSGKTYHRKVVFHRDIDRNSTEFQDFVTYIKERRSVNHLRCIPKLPEVVQQPVVRLAEQIENMQQEAKALELSGQTKKAKQLELRVSELSKNLETFGRDYSKKPQTYWMIEAIQYGWISARMIRAKIFHRFLFQLLESNVEGVNQKERTITLAAICNNMTFHLVCQIIGIFRPSPVIARYSEDGSFAHRKLSEIPENLKQEIYDENTKFLRRLRLLMNALEYCNIVTAQYTEIENDAAFKITKYAHVAPSYKLEEKVPLIDRTKADEPVLREHIIKDLDDLSNFWTDLRYVATFRNVGSEDLPVTDNPYENELRKSVSNSRNWSTRSVFTRDQRALLNERVNRDERTTPLNNIPEMKSLATMMRVPYETIRSYYEKVDSALERRHKYNRERKLERLLLGASRRRVSKTSKFDNYNGRRVINADSGHAFGYGRTEGAVKKRIRGFMDDMQDLPELQDNSPLERRIRRIKRNVWTEQEDDVLLYSYTILKHRVKNNRQRFLWAPIMLSFPKRKPNAGRHRINKLLSQPIYRERYESYLVLWNIFFKEGLANGDIKDKNPDDNVHVDVLSYVAYFVQRLQELDANPVELALPNNITKAHEQFEFIYNENAPALCEDVFHECPAMIQRMQILCQTSLTIRKYTDSFYDQSESIVAAENNPTERLCRVIRMYALMILMTPAEYYDPFYGFHVLAQFPAALREATFEEMRAKKALVLVHGDRPIPGSRLTLSAKFMRDMRGYLPAHMLLQAREYEKFLSTQTEKFKFSPIYVSSEFVLRGTDKTLVNLDLDIQKVKEPDQIITSTPTPKEVTIKMLDPKEYDDEISKYIDSQEESEGRLIQSVLDALYTQGETGFTLYQLKVHLNGSCSDQDIMRAVRKLVYNDPALVCRVGFESVRYVHVKFASSWGINNKVTESLDYNIESREKIIKESKGKFKTDLVRKDIVIPSLWIDMNGHVTELVLNGCKEAVVDLVLRKPGISEADIYRHMSKGLTKREVHDLLDILVEKQTLRQIQYDVAMCKK
ncbi:hypothetical protein [Parasitella parasitica]|uniref:Uncharacterized protein n=1 Tax=Parasitella parasitica TaxID=35722 RepID=A0A0B7NGS5_9FUNG|nr:hypothetical protein [Parasitella parasitica]